MQRTAGFLTIATVSAVLMSLPPGARAQILGAGAVNFEANGAPVAGAPYTANRKTTHVQKLADGTTITHVMLGKEARDSEGRTYSERRRQLPGETDESKATVACHVNDPVAHTSTSWTSQSRVANVFHMAEPRMPRSRDVQPNASARPAPPVRFVEGQSNRDVEELGTKTIEGVTVEGERTTRIIPAGEQGNDQPITITHERWYSPELKLTVLMINTDPRTGETRMELSDIVPGDPDPALFQVPEGYEIRERTPGQLE